ncbi:MAG: CHAT domain-containing protein, partial [Candidatus Binatus sp.]|uniref:CHAT domain-containing protein n=1 Tax=Candidatus Binatus sp. TaxID=2811406 RepID=UPI0027261712|nr:CHAT domain-containing protein [Candidatus Binatus sp.]
MSGPYRALHYLPFAALQNPEGGFLNDRYGLRFLPAASVLKFLRPGVAKKEAQLLALGNPDLGDPKLDLQFA